MIKTLYKTFQHWSESGSVYIISDTHFEDSDMDWRIDSIKTLTGRNDLTPDFIPIYINREINKICGKNDTLIILGDIGNVEWIKKLKAGYKVLIMGNHDKGVSNYQRIYDTMKCHELTCNHINIYNCKTCDNCVEYTEDNHLFDEVYEGPLFISKNIVLSHEQMPPGPYFNIHGHLHNDISDEYLDYLSCIRYSDCYLNCCCEHNAFRPINLGDLIKEKGLGSKYEDIHRVTIDKATLNNKLKFERE